MDAVDGDYLRASCGQYSDRSANSSQNAATRTTNQTAGLPPRAHEFLRERLRVQCRLLRLPLFDSFSNFLAVTKILAGSLPSKRPADYPLQSAVNARTSGSSSSLRTISMTWFAFVLGHDANAAQPRNFS